MLVDDIRRQVYVPGAMSFSFEHDRTAGRMSGRCRITIPCIVIDAKPTIGSACIRTATG